MYDAFELCISLVAETYKKRRIFAPRRFHTDATVDPPPARDWRRADWSAACRCKPRHAKNKHTLGTERVSHDDTNFVRVVGLLLKLLCRRRGGGALSDTAIRPPVCPVAQMP